MRDAFVQDANVAKFSSSRISRISNVFICFFTRAGQFVISEDLICFYLLNAALFGMLALSKAEECQRWFADDCRRFQKKLENRRDFGNRRIRFEKNLTFNKTRLRTTTGKL